MVCRETDSPTYEGEDFSPDSIYIVLLSVLLSVLWWYLSVCSSWETITLTSIPTSNGLGWADIQKLVFIRDSFRGFCRKAYLGTRRGG